MRLSVAYYRVVVVELKAVSPGGVGAFLMGLWYSLGGVKLVV